jgi:hypothetical protein
VPPKQHCKTLPDGRTVVVQRENAKEWVSFIEGKPDSWVIGWPLAGVIADSLGLDPAHAESPPWIDDWAREIQAK